MFLLVVVGVCVCVGEGDGSVFSVRWIGCCCWCLNGKGLYVSDLNLTEPLTYYFLLAAPSVHSSANYVSPF